MAINEVINGNYNDVLYDADHDIVVKVLHKYAHQTGGVKIVVHGEVVVEDLPLSTWDKIVDFVARASKRGTVDRSTSRIQDRLAKLVTDPDDNRRRMAILEEASKERGT